MRSDVLSKLSGVKKAGGGSIARCPAHEDKRQSLSIGEGDDGRTLLKCHAGCTTEAIVAAMGLTVQDLFPERQADRRELARYAYRDEAGVLLYEVVRFEPKDFRQRRPDGAGGWTWNLRDTRRVLYRLPELTWQPSVVIVEGEKDADRLWTAGIPATTNVGGAGKWKPEYTAQLLAAGVSDLIIIPDNDDPGRAHAAQVSASWLPNPSRVVSIPGLAPKGDVSDYLAAHTLDDLRALLAPPREIPPWLNAEDQWDALAAEDAEGLSGRRVYLGLPVIDNTINGIRRGEVLGLMGRPGIGKTIVLSHVSEGIAEMDGVGHVFFSLEMPGAQIVARLQQRLFGLGRKERETAAHGGFLDRDRYRRAFQSLLIVDTPGLSVGQMEGILRRVMDGPFKNLSLGLVTVDHLGLIGGDRKLTTYDRVSLQAREIKELAKRFQCAVLLAVQVNREAGGDGSRELGLGSARDSGVIEEAMDYMVGLRRLDRNLEASVADRQKYQNVIFAKVIKNRHGETDIKETAYRFYPQGLRLQEDAEMGHEQTDVARIAAAGGRRR